MSQVCKVSYYLIVLLICITASPATVLAVVAVEFSSINTNGWIGNTTYEENWNALRGAERGTRADVNHVLYVGAQGYDDLSNGRYHIDRSVIVFDISVLPEGITIESATLHAHALNEWESYLEEGTYFTVVGPATPAEPDGVTIEDFDQVGAVDDPEIWSDVEMTHQEWVPGNSYAFELNEAALAHLGTGEYFSLGLRADFDILDIAPPLQGSNSYWGIDNSSTNRPYLEVVYSVPENTLPTITLNGEETVELTVGDTYVDAGATASDEEDGDLTESIDVDSDVDIDVEGEYSVVYTVTDSGGLTASVTRTVIVRAAEPEGPGAIAFLPGITGSRLYMQFGGVEKRFWESGIAANIAQLSMNHAGESENEYIYTRDVVDEIRPFTGLFSWGEAYRVWLEELADMQDEEVIGAYRVLPYDWRLAIPWLAKNGVAGEYDGEETVNYNERGDEPYLIAQLRALAAESPNGEVTIVAHSMGGLLAKYLIQSLDADDPLLDAITSVVFVGTPHLGTPKTIGELLHGSVVSAPRTSRDVTENMPGAMQLLPSERYFEDVDVPVIIVADDLQQKEYQSIGGVSVESYDDMRRFLTGWDGAWDKPKRSDLRTPNVLDGGWVNYGRGFHAGLDHWQAPEGMRVVNLTGWGVLTPRTVRYIEVCGKSRCKKKDYKLAHYFGRRAGGDGTVFAPASREVFVDETYYVALHTTQGRYGEDYKHGTLLSVPDVHAVIHSVVSGGEVETGEGIYTDVPTMARSTWYLEANVFSPVDLHLYAGSDHTGVTGAGSEATAGRPYETQLAYSYYEESGEVKSAGARIPHDGMAVVLTGTGEGVFSHRLAVSDGREEQAEYWWRQVAVGPMSSGTVLVSPDVARGEAVPVLMYDYDGDGSVDVQLAPGEEFNPDVDEVASFDTLRDAIRAANMKRKLERWFLLRVTLAERLYEKGNTKASDMILRTIKWSTVMRVRKGDISKEDATEIVRIVKELRAYLAE